MKKIVTILLSISIIFAMTSCKKEDKQPNVDDIMSTIRNEIDFPEMADIDKNNIEMYYDFDVTQIDQLAYIVAGSGIAVDEVLIVKVNKSTDMDSIKTKIETRKNSQYELFSTYDAKGAEMIKKAVIEIKGNYAFFAVTNDNDKAKKLFNASF